jgi:hypothetical protein
MKNETQERTPRGIDQLVLDFQALAGNFGKFNRGMNERERVLFKGWLSKMRATPPTISA